MAKIGPELESLEQHPDRLLARIREVAKTELAESNSRLSGEEQSLLFGQIVDDVLGLGPLEPFLATRPSRR